MEETLLSPGSSRATVQLRLKENGPICH
eukprot:COSAG02_NODE_67939_length_251_cov_2.368421_1_plen_27_part_10